MKYIVLGAGVECVNHRKVAPSVEMGLMFSNRISFTVSGRSSNGSELWWLLSTYKPLSSEYYSSSTYWFKPKTRLWSLR